MATLLQKKLAQAIVESAKKGKRTNKKDLVISSGYSLRTAEGHAPEIINQKGVQEELGNLGFDSESAKKVVKNILTKGKEENRLKAADMIFKVGGDYAAEKHINLNIHVPIYGGNSVNGLQGHDGDKENLSAEKKD